MKADEFQSWHEAPPGRGVAATRLLGDDIRDDEDINDLYGPDAFLGDNFPVTGGGRLFTSDELVKKLTREMLPEEEL